MAKVVHIPTHYSITMLGSELREVLIALEAFCREYEVEDSTLKLMGELREGYRGEVPSPPGPPEEGATA